jgi:HlyD family secretion protein
LSAIEGAKNQVDVDVSEGDLNQARIAIRSHKISEGADLERLQEKKNKTIRDADRARSYLDQMVLRAPHDGIVSLLPNFRSSGSFGSTPPPFKEGDRVWTGAAIAEIPDLSRMRLELKLEEVERGKVRLGQAAKIRVDAIPEREFTAKLDWISPIAAVAFKGMGLTEKTFPAYATLRNSDARLRPGMTGSAEIVIENLGSQLLIPIRASVTQDGKPAVYLQRGTEFVLRPIEVGKRNETDIVVLKGLELGDVVALENPADAARRARKLQ